MTTAWLFPGQGAQHVGMGHDLYRSFDVARKVFDLAEEASGLPLTKLCFEGPEDELNRTDICQPAIFTVSAAALAVLEELTDAAAFARLRPAYVAGLSLGEYSALYAAGAMDLPVAVRLLKLRGQYMQAAAAATPSGMVSLLGADAEVGEKVCHAARGDGVLVQANFNCPGQIVLSGSAAACKKAVEVAAECGASGAVELKVAGAFHSPLMQPAADRLAEALSEVEFRPPAYPVLSNVTAQPHTSNQEIRQRLLKQLTAPVLWQQCCEAMLGGGVDEFIEIGPGRVLAGLMRRIDRKARVTCLNGQEALEKFAGAAV